MDRCCAPALQRPTKPKAANQIRIDITCTRQQKEGLENLICTFMKILLENLKTYSKAFMSTYQRGSVKIFFPTTQAFISYYPLINLEFWHSWTNKRKKTSACSFAFGSGHFFWRWLFPSGWSPGGPLSLSSFPCLAQLFLCLLFPFFLLLALPS